jgi:hypothetical protein
MEAKHTPAPWRVEPDSSHFDSLTTIANGSARVAEAAGRTLAECEANAHLIAAAPDLLEALKVAMEWISNWEPNFTDDPEWPADRDLIAAAPAKAEPSLSGEGK